MQSSLIYLTLLTGFITGTQVRSLKQSSQECVLRDQFYLSGLGECRNCSDLRRFFSSPRGFTNNRKEVSGDEENVEVIEADKKESVNEAVLSRLISISNEEPGQEDEGSQADYQTNQQSYTLADIAESSDTSILFDSFVTRFARSKFVQKELLEAIRECKENQNVNACNMWSNLCAITMYSYSDSSKRRRARDSTSIRSGKTKSWQDCAEFNRDTICNSLREWHREEKKSSFEVPNIYAELSTSGSNGDFDDDLTRGSKKLSSSSLLYKLNQPVQLLVYRYALNGLFLGVEQFGLNELEQFCVVSDNRRTRSYPAEENFVRVGRSSELAECKFDSFEALLANSNSQNFNETILMDLYLGYSLSNGGLFVRPVPIVVKNFLYNGQQVNERHLKNPSRLRLVYRFFTHSIVNLDNWNSSSAIHRDQLDDSRSESATNVLLFADTVSLDLKFKRQDKGALLSSIQLTMGYNLMKLPAKLSAATSSANLTRQQVVEHHETKVEIRQNLIDIRRLKSDLDLVTSILCILSGIWALVKYYNFHRYSGLVKLDLGSLFRFLIIACDILANIIVSLNFLLANYLFLALKFQSSVQVLNPEEALESAILTNFKLAFLLKVIGFVHKLYIHLNVDIFFLDWERPKMLTSNQILNYTSSTIGHHQQQQVAKQDNANTNPDQTGSKLAPYLQSASFWRPYTVINRWIQMQTLRRQDLSTQLILFVLTVQVCDIRSLNNSNSLSCWWRWQAGCGVVRTDGGNVYQLTLRESDLFRMVILALVYLAISIGQIGFKKYLHEPMIRNSINEFVDLCSVANVSLFCMLFPRYGYYVHGRNANGSSDCSIAEMSALLEREERDLCTNRGLAANSDQQSFLIVLPKIINDHYRKLLLKADMSGSLVSQQLLKSSNNTQQASLLKSAFNIHPASSFGGNRVFIETIMAKNKAINTFLANFLEHVYKDIDYTIRDRRRFEGFLPDVNFFGGPEEEEQEFGHASVPVGSHASAGLATINSQAGQQAPNAASAASNHSGLMLKASQNKTQAIFYNDYSDSFANLLWLGLEADLIMVELMSLLLLDYLLGQPALVITASSLFLLHQLFRAFYIACARNNLVNKALVDEKFLFR